MQCCNSVNWRTGIVARIIGARVLIKVKMQSNAHNIASNEDNVSCADCISGKCFKLDCKQSAWKFVLIAVLIRTWYFTQVWRGFCASIVEKCFKNSQGSTYKMKLHHQAWWTIDCRFPVEARKTRSLSAEKKRTKSENEFKRRNCSWYGTLR